MSELSLETHVSNLKSSFNQFEAINIWCRDWSDWL